MATRSTIAATLVTGKSHAMTHEVRADRVTIMADLLDYACHALTIASYDRRWHCPVCHPRAGRTPPYRGAPGAKKKSD
jgi:hypothetical protein